MEYQEFECCVHQNNRACLNSDIYPCFNAQIQNLECEIEEKKKQMGVLEQRIVANGEASVANASYVEMQQVNQFIHSPMNYMLLFYEFVID